MRNRQRLLKSEDSQQLVHGVSHQGYRDTTTVPFEAPLTDRPIQLLPDTTMFRSARQNAILKMQQTHGNAAVRRLLSAQSNAVQRCGGTVHPGCSCATGDNADADESLLQRQPSGTSPGRPSPLPEATVQPQSVQDQVQRREYANCSPPRLSLVECPPREPGEKDRATSLGMFFLPLESYVTGEVGNVVANFAIGSAALKPNLKTLKVWTDFIKAVEKNGSRWEIIGFSDCEGKEGRNKGLREARARAVFDLLPKSIQSSITSVSGASEHECLTENTTPGDRLLNRSAALFLVGHELDFSSDPKANKPITGKLPTQEPNMEDCSPDQKKRMAVSFPLGKRMIQTARRVISSMKKGSEEEKLFMKYFGKDAFEHRWHIDRGYMDTLRAWDGSPSYRCVAQGTDPCEDSSTEGYTGAKALLTGHGIVMCENAFKHYPDDAIGLAEVIVHEEAHALDWDRDIEYCNHTTGCPLTTTQAEANADSYSAFAGAAFRKWG